MAAALVGKPFDSASVAIEGYRAAVHTLSLPASAQKQLAEVLPFELEAAMPVDMAESIFDYRVLTKARYGAITTEILDAPPFYYAEDYHQQYLAKNPWGYCGIGGTGVACPVGVGAATSS